MHPRPPREPCGTDVGGPVHSWRSRSAGAGQVRSRRCKRERLSLPGDPTPIRRGVGVGEPGTLTVTTSLPLLSEVTSVGVSAKEERSFQRQML